MNAFKRAAVTSAFIATVFAVLVLIALSPLALKQLGPLRGVNWTQLSNIGQTYGAASALLTGLALIGVAGSMVFQVRAIQVGRDQSIRDQHVHLIEMSLADPVYWRAWGADPKWFQNVNRSRQQTYANLIVSFWQNAYLLGNVKEPGLRAAFEEFFQGEAGREYWDRAGKIRLRSSQTRRDKRFHYMMDEEYHKAIAAGPSTVPAEPSLILPSDRRPPLRNSTLKRGTVLLLGTIGGIAIERCLQQRKR